MASKRVIPPLVRLSISEAQAVESMFRLYDYKCTGRIPQHLAFKLFTSLGMDFSIHSLPMNGSLKDLLLFLDMRVVDPEPALYAQMHSFTHLVAKKIDLRRKKNKKGPGGGEGDDDAEGEEGGEFDGATEMKKEGGGAEGNRQRSSSDASHGSISSKAKDSEEGAAIGGQSREKYITVDAVNEFMASLGRPPLSKTQLDLMLGNMLEYDDCNESTGDITAVSMESFSRDFTNFAKKSNALKNFK